MIGPSVAIILVREKVLFFLRLNKSLIACQTFFALALFAITGPLRGIKCAGARAVLGPLIHYN